jgi:putative ABC transport system substrate-binding protein
MRRRDFIKVVPGSAIAWPFAVRAQQQDRMRRVGVLLPTAADNAVFQARMAAFLSGLQQLGWTEGRNVRINTRWYAGDADLIRKYAVELVALGPDVAAPAAGDPHNSDRVRARR